MLYLLTLAAIFLFFLIPAYLAFWWEERQARKSLAKAQANGRNEPVSIRPWIDPAGCIGCGACTRACPEGKVLRVLDGTAVVVEAASCVGHGACEAACPTGALELVFGSERRGVEIPAISPDFESNVPGLFIAGELGGMGLIANAVEQGRQVVEHIQRSRPTAPKGGLDLVIIGAGPAGISAGLHAAEAGLSHLIVEQMELGGAIRSYPRKKIVMSKGFELPGVGVVPPGTLTKEELIDLFEQAAPMLELSVGERVTGISRVGGAFTVETDKRSLRSARVLMAIGRRGTPRRLGVPGEDSKKVAYRLLEPDEFEFAHVLVVGGGDSAVEAACALAEVRGTRVSLSYRRQAISRPKEANCQRLDDLVMAGKIDLYLSSEVIRIAGDRVALQTLDGEVVLANDQVFAFIGGSLPTALLTGAGIQIERHFGKRIEAVAS